ncbi:unnamed protein product [Pleuronectes platessa]|uniref:Uncharacterized protein n=1 Tax=Pleuronectes platessa TaxID=8262 RepID=A0A9N7YV53_PLEPL|nr:unnamed protein product [Pleuronectes platessa]
MKARRPDADPQPPTTPAPTPTSTERLQTTADSATGRLRRLGPGFKRRVKLPVILLYTLTVNWTSEANTHHDPHAAGRREGHSDLGTQPVLQITWHRRTPQVWTQPSTSKGQGTFI